MTSNASWDRSHGDRGVGAWCDVGQVPGLRGEVTPNRGQHHDPLRSPPILTEVTPPPQPRSPPAKVTPKECREPGNTVNDSQD